ncbi:MAG: DUF1189 domain-containing protein [Rickettsia endosymbiont of Culicoides impunctatus]|uniref:DUF1189 family protein n=1 Tax=unclassified Candidatus Tisiphia TaxID=2996318 RepID=UPI001E802450|nr:MAG: DUF1189 domain-containing protein [Rickettsia endosymbiont of Culicoides impunctatus]
MTTKLLSVFSWFSTLLHQLWLSISSVNFYQDVYKSYKGYGIKYIFAVSFISSLIYCIVIFNYLLVLTDYFTENRLTKGTITIEHILKQLPEIYYDGNKILVDQDEPIYLLDENGNKLAVIDSKNQLSYSDKIKIPILFGSNNITLTTVEITDKKKSMFSIGYSKLFTPDQKILTEEVIKKHFAKTLIQAPKIFIYILMPIIIVFRFATILFEKSFIIILVYLLTNYFGPKSSWQTCIRITLFSSGIAILLQPMMVIFLPEFSSIIFFIQMFTSLLLLLAMLRIRNK